MADLTPDDLAKVQESLRRRYVARIPGVIDVGFGVAAKDRLADAARGYAAVFYVKKKRTPRAVDQRLPPTVRVRLWRGGGYDTVEFPTDVVEHPRPARQTGVGLSFGGVADRVTTGVAVSWLFLTDRQWGVVTVGHGFTSSRVGDAVTVGGRLGRDDIEGMLAWVHSGDDVDAALVTVQGADLRAAGIIVNEDVPDASAVHSLAELAADAGPRGAVGGAPGMTLRIPDGVGLWLAGYFPDVLPGMLKNGDSLAHVVRAVAAGGNTFEGGTSGSPWVVGTSAVGMQTHGQEDGGFREGYAQALTVVLAAVRDGLPKALGTGPGNLSGFTMAVPF